jgi:hypothetical protein
MTLGIVSSQTLGFGSYGHIQYFSSTQALNYCISGHKCIRIREWSASRQDVVQILPTSRHIYGSTIAGSVLTIAHGALPRYR